ncbi:MAG: glycosyltransferase 87 family protein [Chloroflexota bacterium]
MIDAARWNRPSTGLVLAAAIGAVLLAVVAVTWWPHFGDEHAYWAAAQRLVAGEPLYDPNAPANQPFAYWYPPVLAQLLAPFTLFVPAPVFTIAWTILLVGCVWWLAGRNVFVALALVAFLPVALELRVRNVHLLIAVLTVLALRRSWVFWIPAVAMKIGPLVGPVYLLAAGRRREAVLVGIAGLAVVAVSVALAPVAWLGFLDIATGRAGSDAGGWFGIPYSVRLGAGVVLAALAGRRGGRAGEVALVVAILVANPTLWANSLSLLLAIVPLSRQPARPQVIAA